MWCGKRKFSDGGGVGAAGGGVGAAEGGVGAAGGGVGAAGGGVGAVGAAAAGGEGGLGLPDLFSWYFFMLLMLLSTRFPCHVFMLSLFYFNISTNLLDFLL